MRHSAASGSSCVVCRIRTWWSSTPRAVRQRSRLPLQLFGREYGHQQFSGLLEYVPRWPPCRAYRSPSTSGKSTVSLDDFEHCELIIRHGTQSRHESSAHDGHSARASARRADHRVQSLREPRARTLHRIRKTRWKCQLWFDAIASSYYQVKVGGDAAALRAS